MLLPIHAIDFLHDPLGPLNSRGDQGFRPRAWLGIEEIFRCPQMTGHQDSRHDREHSFASFVHGRQLSIFAFSSLSDGQIPVKAPGRDIGSTPDQVVGGQENIAPAEPSQRQPQLSN